MAYSLIQSATVKKGDTFENLLTISALTSGSLVIVGGQWATGFPWVPSDGTNTYTQIDGNFVDAGDGETMAWFYAQNVAPAGTTITLGSGLQGQVAVMLEISGVATTSALRTSDSVRTLATRSATTDAQTSNNITPTTGDLLVALYNDGGGDLPTITAGTGWSTGIANPATGLSGAAAVEWKTAASGSAQNATFSQNKTGGNYTVFIAAFKPLGGGPAFIPPPTKVRLQAVQRASLV